MQQYIRVRYVETGLVAYIGVVLFLILYMLFFYKPN